MVSFESSISISILISVTIHFGKACVKLLTVLFSGEGNGIGGMGNRGASLTESFVGFLLLLFCIPSYCLYSEHIFIIIYYFNMYTLLKFGTKIQRPNVSKIKTGCGLNTLPKEIEAANSFPSRCASHHISQVRRPHQVTSPCDSSRLTLQAGICAISRRLSGCSLFAL